MLRMPSQRAIHHHSARHLGAGLRLLFAIALGALLLAATAQAQAQELDAKGIFVKAQAVNPGQDQQSKLTLLIKDGDGNTRKVVLKRFWKNYSPGGEFAAKVLLFHEYPPAERGKAFMVWSYPEETQNPPDQWFFYPPLRAVHKLPQQFEENIQGSDVRASDMDPRSPSLDEHELMREEEIGTQKYYVVSSSPINPDKGYPYSKVVRWISADNFLIDKINYYDKDQKLLKKQTISWKRIGDAWVWQKVVVANVQSGSQTTLNLTEIQVNQGLKESLFTERMMLRGGTALR